MEGYNIDNEVIKYIATHVKSNIRELEGALTKIVALSRLNKCDITLQLAEEALKDIISPGSQREVTAELILQIVADHFGLTRTDSPGYYVSEAKQGNRLSQADHHVSLPQHDGYPSPVHWKSPGRKRPHHHYTWL